MNIKTHAQDGEHWYTLNARNGAVLLTSETYSTSGNMLRAARKTARALSLPLVHHG